MSTRQATPAERARARRDAAVTSPPPRLGGMRASIARLVVTSRGRDYPVSAAIDGDTPWEMTIEGAATVTLPIRSVDGSLLEVLADEANLQSNGVRLTVDGVDYVVSSASADGTGLYTLTFEDEVAWRLRQFTSFLAATRATTTRAGFVRRLVDEAARPPREAIRSFIPEVRDVQPIARSSA